MINPSGVVTYCYDDKFVVVTKYLFYMRYSGLSFRMVTLQAGIDVLYL
jgi:hypothetical protein